MTVAMPLKTIFLLGLLMLQSCMFNDGLHTRWSQDVDQRHPDAAYGYSVPTVSQGHIIIAGQDARLHIYGPSGWESGRIALDAPCEGGILVLPNGHVVLADTQGMLYAIDVHEEKVLWKYQLSSSPLGHPVATENGILVQTSDNHIYYLNQKGKKQWSYAGIVGGLSMYFGSSPVVKGRAIYAILNNGDVVALNASSGDLIWQKQLNVDPFARVLSELRAPIADPVIAEGQLIVSFYQGDIQALDLRTGDIVWKRPFSLKSTPLLDQGILYLSTSKGDAVALDPKDGSTRWKQHLNDAEVVGPVLQDGQLWFADHTGQVYALNLEGDVQDQLYVAKRIDRAPVGSEHGILLRNHRGVLYLVSP